MDLKKVILLWGFIFKWYFSLIIYDSSIWNLIFKLRPPQGNKCRRLVLADVTLVIIKLFKERKVEIQINILRKIAYVMNDGTCRLLVCSASYMKTVGSQEFD